MPFFEIKKSIPKRYVFSLALLLSFFTYVALFLHRTPENDEKFYSNNAPFKYPAFVKYSYRTPVKASTSTLYDSAAPNKVYNTFHSANEKRIQKIDKKYCGEDRCRFLLPIAITEQETKAQLHFRQLAFLAGTLGRTIVLPNTYNSQLGSCLHHPFHFYYNQSWLDNNKEHFKYITMEKFRAWMSERQLEDVTPTAQELYIQGSRRSRLLRKVDNCFKDSFDFSGRPTVHYQFPDHRKQSRVNVTDIMFKLLSDETRENEYLLTASINKKVNRPPPVDVVNLFYDRRYKFIKHKNAEIPLTYSQHWVDIANDIAAQLSPYVAIHWRMERLEPVSNLLPCAKSLVESIHALEDEQRYTNDSKMMFEGGAKKPLPNVFLLTDYPHLLNTTGARPESISFQRKELKPEHHEAMRYLYQHLNITLISAENGKIPYDELPRESWHILPVNVSSSSEKNLFPDRSVLGIIDKLVAIKAQWFYAGRPGVCAKSSSFTSRISGSRLRAFKSQRTKITENDSNSDDGIISPLRTFDVKEKRS